MTTPNPTPTTREREAAGAISQDIYNTTSQSQRNDEYDKYQRKAFDNLVVPLIAAALARERREGMERACACVCDLCRISVPEIHQGEWCHRVGKRDYRLCEAASIRAKMDTPATE